MCCKPKMYGKKVHVWIRESSCYTPQYMDQSHCVTHPSVWIRESSCYTPQYMDQRVIVLHTPVYGSESHCVTHPSIWIRESSCYTPQYMDQRVVVLHTPVYGSESLITQSTYMICGEVTFRKKSCDELHDLRLTAFLTH